MPIKDPIIRREYARLSMAIRLAKVNNEDIASLLTQRQSLINQGINTTGIKSINEGINKSINEGINKSINEGINKSINEGINGINAVQTPYLRESKSFYTGNKPLAKDYPNSVRSLTKNLTQENFSNLISLIQDLKIEFQKLNTNLAELVTTNQILTQQTRQLQKEKQLVKPEQTKIPRAEQLLRKSSKSPTKKTTIRVVKQLLTEIKTKHENFSDFVRKSLFLYRDKQISLSNKVWYQSKKEQTKLSVRLEPELLNLYLNFPEGQKTQLLNQILGSVWESNL